MVSSPTGSGKSTRIPVWALERGKVLVVEPRRIAARSLALHVASQTGTLPGELVGWAVRDDVMRRESTKILFCTPGVALGMLGSGEADAFSTWILDEFHERRADVDAFLAFARSRGQARRLVLLSATISATELARALDATVLESSGRSFAVDTEYLPAPGGVHPDPSGLPLRLESALRRLDPVEGAVLVFLPGTGEIEEARAWLSGRIPGRIEPLHGMLALEEQQRVLSPSDDLRIVLATNVAESALTVPDVVAVVDSGLERRIERSNGFARLELAPISQASADQRAGRAGRVRAGRCLRLWAQSARLEAHPRPAIQVDDPRDWLLPLLVAGADPQALAWLDRPRADGVRNALEAFGRLGLWEEDRWESVGRATARAGVAARLPLPADLAGFCLLHEGAPSLRDALALAAALSASRPVLRGKPSPEMLRCRREIARGGGDESLLCRILEAPEPIAQGCGIHQGVWREAVRLFQRLREAAGVQEAGWPRDVQVDALARSLWRLEPRALRRRRGAPGKEEYALGDGAALWPSRDSLSGLPEIALALGVHGGRTARGEARVWMDAALGLGAADCLRLGIGRLEVERAAWTERGLEAKWSRKVGKDVIGFCEGVVEDPEVARAAVWMALAASERQIVESAWERQVLAWCHRRGRWEPAPQSADAWFAGQAVVERARGWELSGKQDLLTRLTDPLWENPFPVEHREPPCRWALVWDVRKGKVRARLLEGKSAKPRSLAIPAGWSLA